MRRIWIALRILLLCALLAVGFLVFHFKQFYERPAPGDVTVVIDKGWGIKKISGVLAEAGVVSSAEWFYLLARFSGEGFVQAGEYHITKGELPEAVLGRLRRGEVIRHRFTIPEGLDAVKGVAPLLAAAGWPDAVTLLADDSLPSQLGLESRAIEGWLFPDTYYYRQGDQTEEIVLRMVTRARTVLAREWEQRPADYPLTAYEALILASIIEKETGASSERAHVSAVFHNRLKKGMRLQTDPTVIYGIKNFDGNLTRKHLRERTPFNTYVIKGLPPTPICNPGQAAIHAAFHPSDSKDLYFVARGDGTHAFAETLQEHNRNVRQYQLKRKKGE